MRPRVCQRARTPRSTAGSFASASRGYDPPRRFQHRIKRVTVRLPAATEAPSWRETGKLPRSFWVIHLPGIGLTRANCSGHAKPLRSHVHPPARPGSRPSGRKADAVPALGADRVERHGRAAERRAEVRKVAALPVPRPVKRLSNARAGKQPVDSGAVVLCCRRYANDARSGETSGWSRFIVGRSADAGGRRG